MTSSNRYGSSKGPYRRKAPKRPIVDPTIGLDPSITQVWTDGACAGNPGPGGWGWVTPEGREGNGGALHTTNQRMEVQAALEAIRAIGDRPLAIVSDSSYLTNCFQKFWWKGWLARGWKNSQGAPVASIDLWEPLIDLAVFGGVSITDDPARTPVPTGISFLWVKGHAGFALNERADELAVAGRYLAVA